MKIALIIIGIILAGFLISFAVGRNKTQSNKNSADTVKTTGPDENPYMELRNLALSFKLQDTDTAFPQEHVVVYGVVMDWDMIDGVMTTVAYKTGDASMYISSGGGIIGGGDHENVNHAARQFVDKASAYLVRASQVDSTPLPERNSVIFYLLTNKGIYAAREKFPNFENNSSPLLELFEEGNNVITELRVVGKMQ